MSKDTKKNADDTKQNMYYVYSTLSGDQDYTQWNKAPEGGMSSALQSIRISGKANVVNKNLITPSGVVTKISEKQLEVLKDNTMFMTHKDNGFIKVMQKKEKISNALSDMKEKDSSAPLIKKDFENPPKILGEMKVNEDDIDDDD